MKADKMVIGGLIVAAIFLLGVIGGWNLALHKDAGLVTDRERITWVKDIVRLSERNTSLEWNLKSCEELLQRDALDTFLGIYQAVRM